MNKEILTKIYDLYCLRLQEKTGWGKNEVIKLYRDCVNEVLLEYIDKSK